MNSLKNRNKGFTIVELLIVIVVIGILAALVITTYSGIQAKGRNSQRSADVSAIVTQLEAYKSDNGNYPSLGNLNSQAWRTANLKSLDNDALVDPQSVCNPTTATDCLKAGSGVTSDVGVAKSYVYAVADSTGATCEADATTCAQYRLIATYEGSVNGKPNLIKKNLD
jgi:prepilin-type N-terminal cleavage/methylation domain-containing protein